MGSFSLVHWLIVLFVVMLLFGASRLSDMGKGLGEGIKNFKKGLKDDEEDEDAPPKITKRKVVDVDGEEVEVIVKPKQLAAPKKKRTITVEVDDDADEDEVRAKVAAAKKKAAAEIEKDETA